MIAGFDHVVIAVRDLDAGIGAYQTLLGRGVATRETRDGAESAMLVTDNIAVELMAAHGEGEAATRLRAALETGEGLKSLVFAVDDIERAHRRAERVGLTPTPTTSRDRWRSFRADTHRTHGVRIFLLQRQAPLSGAPVSSDGVTGLDHIVIRTPDAERALALYGARLGLDLRLDRDLGGRRFLFFRCGDAVVEIVHDTTMTTDTLWGLSWRVSDADGARACLAGAGVDVSEVRAGQKPGTRVFTVRDGTCGVPTLMVGPAA